VPVGEKHPIVQDAGLKSEVGHHERKTLAGAPLRTRVNPRRPRLFRSNSDDPRIILNDYRTGMLTRCIPSNAGFTRVGRHRSPVREPESSGQAYHGVWPTADLRGAAVFWPLIVRLRAATNGRADVRA
jgi:hypothetical protein